ncbi:hypothetical protein WMF11_15075 [Sorangium sp. So ce295]|uniref:hypothetical protein n=1 Tax=Sorangium sp. So ce295 TaxID=3133295 RepID=UPI003F609DF8
MSTLTRGRAHCGRSFVAKAFVTAASMCLVACGLQPSGTGGGGEPSASSAPKGAAPRAAARPGMAVLGPDERRVPLLVVPGDALVEVDGQPAYRRDGAIDLTGKVGEVRRVRVWKGAKAALEKDVTIHESQPSPPLVDFNEVPPAKPVAKPKRPARFGGFDDE